MPAFRVAAGDARELDWPDATFDAALLLGPLYHLTERSDRLLALREALRVVKPGGRALVVDMVTHDRKSYQHTMGHHHLGFNEAQVRQWAQDSGLFDTRYRRLPADTSAKGPGLFVATMTKRQ